LLVQGETVTEGVCLDAGVEGAADVGVDDLERADDDALPAALQLFDGERLGVGVDLDEQLSHDFPVCDMYRVHAAHILQE
jgi:hypothetical protein